MEKYVLRKSQKVYIFFKRLLDILFSFLAIILISWFIFIVFIINLFASKGHPVIVQKRLGRNEKSFGILKFRTMKYGVDENLPSAEIVNENEYLTGFGKFLRVTSLDEILQIFNVFIGQMSFIGPRPLIDLGVDHLTNEYRKENGSIALRPGITGLAQINGRVNASPEKKSEYDGLYFKKVSFFLDIKIFFVTIFKILTRKDIFEEKEKHE